jgi:hypothetical protein
MIRIIRVDVREGRLKEAQQQGYQTQNCARLCQEYKATLSDLTEVAWPRTLHVRSPHSKREADLQFKPPVVGGF